LTGSWFASCKTCGPVKVIVKTSKGLLYPFTLGSHASSLTFTTTTKRSTCESHNERLLWKIHDIRRREAINKTLSQSTKHYHSARRIIGVFHTPSRARAFMPFGLKTPTATSYERYYHYNERNKKSGRVLSDAGN